MMYSIRPWEARDEVSLLHMILACLEDTYHNGAEMQPTPKNARVLLTLGMQAASRGEPCLVADAGGIDVPGPIGYNLWTSLPNPLGLDFRCRVLHGLGTYVMVPFRRYGVSRDLRVRAERIGADQGFDKVAGVAFDPVGLRSVLGRGFRPVGQYVEKELR